MQKIKNSSATGEHHYFNHCRNKTFQNDSIKNKKEKHSLSLENYRSTILHSFVKREINSELKNIS